MLSCNKVQCRLLLGLPLVHDKAIDITNRYLSRSANLDLSLHYIHNVDDLNITNKGAIAEQIVGQLLHQPYFVEPVLYYWARQNKSSNAEML